jgi:hypothetical protein
MSFDGALLPMDQSGKLNWSAAGLRFEINAGTFGSRRRRSPWRTQIDGIWRAEGGSETERAGEPCEKEKHQKIKKWKRCFAKSGQTRSNPASTSEMNPRSDAWSRGKITSLKKPPRAATSRHGATVKFFQMLPK